MLAAGCCVLPVALMFVSGIVAGWVASLGISDAAWSWIAQCAVVAVAAVVFLRQLWNRRCAATSGEHQGRETRRSGRLID